MSTQYKWKFEETQPMGGATGNAFTNTLSGAGKSGEEALAREAIQNSCDAGVVDQIQVLFRIEHLEGKDRDQFVKALQLEEGIRPRLKELKLPKKTWLVAPDEPLGVTYVEDFGTQGLGGNPHKRDSNFYKLLLSLGDASKATSRQETGGSYGYGKAALSMNSRLHTIVAYSTYKEDEMGTTARLMGCGYFNPHDFQGEECAGRAWLGKQVTRGGKTFVDPLYDAEAHALASQLGFTPRKANKHGTSLLIVDSNLNADQLMRSIEDWWWPRILDNDVLVQVRVNGESRFPKPKARKDLSPFIDCYNLARGTIEDTGKHRRAGPFNKLDGLSLGSYGVQLVTEDEEEALKEMDEDRLNAVALVRSQRMVVEYLRMGRPSPAAVGVFVGDGDVDEILKLSEPPAHDKWSEESTRLREASIDVDLARAVVKSVKVRLKEKIRSLQMTAEPPRDQQPRHLTALEKELGALLRLGTGKGHVDEANGAPLTIDYDGVPTRTLNGNTVRTATNVSVAAKEDVKAESVKARMRIRAIILEDEDGTHGTHLPVHIKLGRGSAQMIVERVTEEDEHVFLVDVPTDRKLSLQLETGPYDPEWAVRFHVGLEPPEGSA